MSTHLNRTSAWTNTSPTTWPLSRTILSPTLTTTSSTCTWPSAPQATAFYLKRQTSFCCPTVDCSLTTATLLRSTPTVFASTTLPWTPMKNHLSQHSSVITSSILSGNAYFSPTPHLHHITQPCTNAPCHAPTHARPSLPVDPHPNPYPPNL